MELVAVISSKPNAFALERAKKAKVPGYVVDRSIFPNSASFCNAILNKLRDVDTELVVCAGFKEKLNYPVLRFYRHRIIGVQPVLFPAFCTGELDAIWAIERTLELGARVSGATAFFKGEEDNGYGPIIVQKPVRVRGDDTPATLSDRIMREGEWPVLCKAVSLFCERKLHVTGGKVVIDE